MKSTSFLLLCPLFLALGACSTPQSRIESDPATYSSAPPEVQKKISAGEVDVGFTREQVRLALGTPSGISTRTTENGTQEIWSYKSRRPRFGIGFGIGMGSRGTSVGTGVGVGAGGSGFEEPRLRVIIEDDRVTAVERQQKR